MCFSSSLISWLKMEKKQDYNIHRGILNNSVKGKLFRCFVNKPEHENTMCMALLSQTQNGKKHRGDTGRGIWKKFSKKNKS